MIYRANGQLLPHGISYIAVFRNPQQLVRPGDGVQIRAQAVVEIRVRLPDLLQHLDVQAELIRLQLVSVVLPQAREAETFVPPVLAEVAVHGVVL